MHTLLVVATLAALYVLYLLRSLLITLFVAIMFASAVRPLVRAVERRLGWPRAIAGLGVCGAVALVAGSGLAAVVPTLFSGATALLERSGEIYGHWYSVAVSLEASAQLRLGVVLPPPPAQDQVASLLARTVAHMQQALPALTLRVAGALAAVLFGLVMAYYWLEARDELLALGSRLLPPQRQGAFQAIFDDIERMLGAYLGGQAILSLLIGVACLLAFTAIGVPYGPALALGNGLLHMIPILGATVGAVLAVVVTGALAPGKGLATAVAVVLIHQLENQFVAPRVLQRQVGLNALLVLVALTGGAMLGGVVGALVAIPIVGALWVLVHHLLVEPQAARRAAAASQPGDLATGSPESDDLGSDDLEAGSA